MSAGRNRSKRACLLAIWALPLTCHGLEVHDINVTLDDGAYHVSADTTLTAPQEYVFDLLMDYDRFHLLAGGIAESRFLEPDNRGTMRAYTRLESCVWFFCRRIERVERIWPLRPGMITTVAIPERSDFRSYQSRWRLTRVPGGTRVHFEADMQLGFWVPPLIGPWAIRRKLEFTALEVGARIEYLYANGATLADIAPPDVPGSADSR